MRGMKAISIRVSGLVQGVFFRAETRKKAEELGLTGWVKNLSDRSVEIHAEGQADALKKLEEWCWKGPERAQVENVTVEEVPEEGHRSFAIVG